MFLLLEVHAVFETLQLPLQCVRNTHHLHGCHLQADSQQQVDAEDRERQCRDCFALAGSRKKFCELL
jgi:hypothetical protein